jgi:hypothetical protein
MIIIQEKDTNNGIIYFTFKERIKILFFGRLTLGNLALKKFGNCLMRLIIEYNERFKDIDIKNYLNVEADNDIKTE